MQILVTNDDGPDSPFVAPLIRAAVSLGTVTVVLPATERSWTAKAMTRYTDLPLTRLDHKDANGNTVAGFTLGGTPADCVNAGSYVLNDRPPDLVLSGVNAGENTGVSYAISSGTIGACLEANIAQIPAIAFSQQLTPIGFASWAARELARPKTELGRALNRLNTLLPTLLVDLVPKIQASSSQERSQPITWSVNLPARLSSDWRLVSCPLERARYGSCFERHGNILRHTGSGAIRNSGNVADMDVLATGSISLTHINLWGLGQKVVPG